MGYNALYSVTALNSYCITVRCITVYDKNDFLATLLERNVYFNALVPTLNVFARVELQIVITLGVSPHIHLQKNIQAVKLI